MKKSVLVLSSVILLVSCQKSGPSELTGGCYDQFIHEEQVQPPATPSIQAKESWGKNWKYINEYNVIQEPPYNCYDKEESDPVTIRQISTSDGPRYAAAVAGYFNGSDWQNLFPGLGNTENAADLTKLQSGDYFFEVKINGNMTYMVARKLTAPALIDFVLCAEEITE